MRTAILLVSCFLAAGCASPAAVKSSGAPPPERSTSTVASVGAGELTLDIAELI